jgi:MSHA biogenesis protein MshM
MEISRDLYLELSPYLELMQGVRTALSVNEGIIKIVGPDGAGKSALCHKLEADLKKDGTDVICFSSAPESSEYLYERIQSHLGLDKNKNFTKSLTNCLLAKSPPNNKLVVIYDNAEKISKELFIFIRLLNNIHDQSETLVAQVICGTEKLDTLFDDPDLRSLTQYLNQSFTIPPMTREQIQDFYSGFRNKMTITGKELNNTDLTNIYMQGKGMPGKTLELLQHALEPAVDVAESADAPNSVASTTVDTTITDTTKPYKLPDLPDPGGLDTIQPAQDPGPIVAQQVNQVAQRTQNNSSSDEQENLEQEVSEILSEGNERRDPVISKVFYFKAALSSIIVLVTIVLAVVLSVDDEVENNRLAEILADDSPLFMDEVAGTSESEDESDGVIESEGVIDSSAEISIPPEAEIELTNNTPIEATARINTETTPAPISADPESDSLAASNSGPIDESSEQNNIAQLDTPENVFAVENPEAIIEEELAEVIVEDIEEEIVEEIVEEIEEEIEETLEEPAEIIAALQESVTATSTPTEDVSPDENIEAALNTAVSTWVNAWSDGDFMGYLSVYHESFIPSNIDSYDSWVDQRKARIEGVQGIRIGYDRFELIETSPENATVRFWQSYDRNSYSDETWKELQFQNNNGTWLITSERNLQVNRLSN